VLHGQEDVAAHNHRAIHPAHPAGTFQGRVEEDQLLDPLGARGVKLQSLDDGVGPSAQSGGPPDLQAGGSVLEGGDQSVVLQMHGRAGPENRQVDDLPVVQHDGWHVAGFQPQRLFRLFVGDGQSRDLARVKRPLAVEDPVGEHRPLTAKTLSRICSASSLRI
jgi:hypothetical protein